MLLAASLNSRRLLFTPPAAAALASRARALTTSSTVAMGHGSNAADSKCEHAAACMRIVASRMRWR
jgi:hypothetical protein